MDDEPEPHYMRGHLRGHYNRFCVNGDFFQPGKRVLFNPKYFKDFPHFMDHLTLQLQPRFGAVRKICTPNLGHRVRSLEDLQPDQVYVAVGGGRFIHYGYKDIDPNQKKSPPPRNLDFVEPSRRYQVSGKYRKIDTQATVIKCWANGKGKEGSRIIVLPAHRNRPESVEAVVQYVSSFMGDKCGGPVYRLYETSGIKVMSMDQIKHNGCYVALRRKEQFKSDTFHENPQPGFRFSPRLERKRLPPLPYSNKTSSHSSPEHSTASHNGYRRDRERARREDDQVFMARPVKLKRSSERKRQADYDQDNGGVFKARSQNRATRGAREVEDSRNTRTELPIDQRVAEPVQDEDLDNSFPQDDWREERRSREKKGRKDEAGRPPPPAQEKERTYRTNARRPDSPSNEEARKEKEREARARREAEDRARAEKLQQQQEAMRRKKKEKEEQKKRQEEEEQRKREEEEERRKRQEEERKAEKQRERQRKEEERRKAEEKRREEEEKRREEEERRAAVPRTSTPDRYEGTNEDHPRSPQYSPTNNDRRSGTETLRDQQQSEAEQEEWAATRIQAGFRGYRDRRDLKQSRQEEETAGDREPSPREAEPVPVQGEDDWGLAPVPNDDDDRDEQERAATKIQAGFRGAKARREVMAMRAEKEVKDGQEMTPPPSTPPRPASNDPSQTRNVSPNPNKPPDNDASNGTDNDPSDEQISDLDAEHAAATKIQAAFRGQKTRKELAEAQAEREGADGAEGGEQNG